MGDFAWFRRGADPFRRRAVDVVVTYEGGGARGIWHIGALRMLEASQLPDDPRYARLPKYRVLGVNGTSMGALVAALHAVGYKADQMLDLREPVSEQPKPTIWTRILYTLKLRQRIAEGSIVLQNAGILKLIQLFNWRQRIAIWFLSASKSRSNLKKLVFWCSIIAGVFLPVLMFFGSPLFQVGSLRSSLPAMR